MSRTPRVSGTALVDALANTGETIGPGLIRKIMRDTQITGEDLASFLRLR